MTGTDDRLRALEERLYRLEQAPPPPVPNFRHLADADLAKVQDGDSIAYDKSSGRWRPVSGGGGTFAPGDNSGLLMSSNETLVVAAGSSVTLVSLAWSHFDVADWGSGATGQFTVNEAGLYLVTFTARLSANSATTGALRVRLYGMAGATYYSQQPEVVIPATMPTGQDFRLQAVQALTAVGSVRGYQALLHNMSDGSVTLSNVRITIEQLGKFESDEEP